jgi:FtsH-binding integral membrane protein
MEHAMTIPLDYLVYLRSFVICLATLTTVYIFKYDMKKESKNIGVPFVFGIGGVILFNILLIFGNEGYHDIIDIVTQAMLITGILRWVLALPRKNNSWGG